jgi:DNA-binding response OmpR family regulator
MTASDIAPNVPRVLIVEDDADTLAMMRKLLDRVPVSNVSVGSCDEARCAARSEPFDVVISDAGLSDGDGVDLVRELKEQYGCRTVVMSGYDAPDDGTPHGVDLWIAKPVDITQLSRALQTLTRP